MPSSGVEKPDILSDNIEDNYVWEVTQGIVSLLPSFMEGDNLLNIGYSLDRAMALYNVKNLERLDKRHVSVDDYASLNNDELDNRMRQMGVPFIKNDTSKNKKRRLRNWWKNNFGGGTVKSIKYVLYEFIGSGVFIPYDAGNTDPLETSRIMVYDPSTRGQWGDYTISLSYIDWADYSASSGSSGKWSDVNTIGKSNLDIQIKFGDLTNFYIWSDDEKRCDIYYLYEKIRPVGLISTISHIYDGTLSNYKMWYRLDKDGKDEYGVDNRLSFTTAVASSGIVGGGMLLSSGAYMSGTLGKDAVNSTNFTVSFWMRVVSDYANGDTVIDTSTGGMSISANTTWSSGMSGSIGDGTTQVLTAVDMSDGSWYNLVITASSGTGQYITYVNTSGTTVSSSFTSAVLQSGTAFVLGQMTDGTKPSSIEIDELMVFDRVISDSEVLEIYNAGNHFLS